MLDPIAEMFEQGGAVLVGITIIAAIAWTLVLWEALRLYERTAGGWRQLEASVRALEENRASETVIDGLRDSDNVVDRLLRSGLSRRRIDRPAFEAQVMPLLNSETVLFRRSLQTVGVLAATLPLLGLLGTVLGMIATFDVLRVHRVPDVDAMADGISQALITTQAGLVVAVPILLVNGYLSARIRRYLDTSSVMIKRIEAAICEEDDSAAANRQGPVSE